MVHNKSEEEADEISDDGDEGPRRSQRVSSKRKYLNDYILYLSEEEGEQLMLCLNNEPRNFEEAKLYKEWLCACEDEIESITKLDSWELVDLPPRAKAICLKWVFKIKRNSDGSINKYKSRLVAKGYLQR